MSRQMSDHLIILNINYLIFVQKGDSMGSQTVQVFKIGQAIRRMLWQQMCKSKIDYRKT